MNHPQKMEFPTFIKRSFVYLPHLVEGISWVVEHLDDVPDILNIDVPDILNIAGTDTLSYYQLWQLIAEQFGIDKEYVVPRKHEIDLAPRPFRGGLNTRLTKKLGVPLYSALDGIKEMKDERN
jgi:dTDP-4-dehydrorhamnose reductase